MSGWPIPRRRSAPVPPDGAPLQSGRVGRVPLLREPFPLFPGFAPAHVATLHGLPAGFALTGAKPDERQVLPGILGADPDLTSWRPGQILIGDKNYYCAGIEAALAEAGMTLLRPARTGEAERAGSRFFKPLRQTVTSWR